MSVAEDRKQLHDFEMDIGHLVKDTALDVVKQFSALPNKYQHNSKTVQSDQVKTVNDNDTIIVILKINFLISFL